MKVMSPTLFEKKNFFFYFLHKWLWSGSVLAKQYLTLKYQVISYKFKQHNEDNIKLHTRNSDYRADTKKLGKITQ